MKNLSRTSKRIIAIAIALSMALTLTLDGQMLGIFSYADEAVIESMAESEQKSSPEAGGGSESSQLSSEVKQDDDFPTGTADPGAQAPDENVNPDPSTEQANEPQSDNGENSDNGESNDNSESNDDENNNNIESNDNSEINDDENSNIEGTDNSENNDDGSDLDESATQTLESIDEDAFCPFCGLLIVIAGSDPQSLESAETCTCDICEDCELPAEDCECLPLISLFAPTSATIPESVANLAELSEAIDAVNDNNVTQATILLSGTSAFTIAEGETYEIAAPGKDITLTVGSNRRHFEVRNNGTLILGEGITLTRAADLIAAGTGGGGVRIPINQGSNTHIIMNGAVISNNMASSGGGGLQLQSGRFTMNGGEISDNTASSGGGISVTNTGSQVNIHGGKISGNHATGTTDGNGGAIYTAGRVNIYGGEFSDNYAAGNGGAILLSSTYSSLNSITIIPADGATITFSGNESAQGTFMIREGTDLFATYRTKVSPSLDGQWSGGLQYGYNNHDIGANFSQTDLDDYFVVPPAVISTITAIEDLSPAILNQTHYIGAKLDSFNIPETLIGIYDGDKEVEIPITWLASPTYDAATARTCTFRPAPLDAPEGYEFESTDVTKPITSQQIRVTLKDTVANLTELRKALDTIADSDLAAATLLITVKIEITAGESLELRSPNTALTLAVNGNHRHFNIQTGAALALADGVTLTRAATYTGNGGGIEVRSGASLDMSGGQITGFQWATAGGGVWSSGGTFTMSGGIISNITAGGHGAGVHINGNGSFTMTGGEISGNTASGDGRQGGGVYVNDSSFTLSGDAIIRNNKSTHDRGGGVYSHIGPFNMTGGTISGNTAPQNGGGVHANGIFNMSGGLISGNKSTAGNGGGGIFSSSCVFTMTGGEISDNTASNCGGGVYAANSGIFTISGDSVITGNVAKGNDGRGGGGGVFADRSADIRLSGDAVISGNSARLQGGGVEVSRVRIDNQPAASFTMTGGSIMENNAPRGGGIYMGDSSPVSISGGVITDNEAQNGAGIYGKNLNDLRSSLTIGADASFAGNTSTTPGPDKGWQIKEDTALMTAYRASIEVPDGTWSRGFVHGYNGHDISTTAFGADVTEVDRVITVSDIPSGVNNLTELKEALDLINDSDITEAISINLNGLIAEYIIPESGEHSDYVIAAPGKDVTLTVNANRRHFTVYGTLTMENGITLTRAESLIAAGIHGGNVGVVFDGSFIMNGGTITGNSTALVGGGVVVSQNATFTMNDGEISNNIAVGAGGGGIQINNPTASVFIHGGKISGNRATGTAVNNGGGAIRAWGKLTITGGEFSDNWAAGHGGAIIVPTGTGSNNTSIDNVAIGQAAVFKNNESALGTFMIREGTGLFDTYRTKIGVADSKWTDGLLYGYNNHDIGSAFNPADLGEIFYDYDRLELPGTPGEVIVTSDKDGNVSMIWNEPADGGEVEEYEIVIKNNINGDQETHTVSGGDDRFELNLPDGSYSVRIRAKNAKGDGAESDSVNVTVKRMFEVSFHVNDGSTEKTIVDVIPGESIGTANIPASPARAGFAFLGWYMEQYGPLDSTRQFDPDTAISENISVFARWNPPEVHFYNRDELVTSLIQTAGGGKSLADSGHALPGEPEARPGQSGFLGWVTESGEAFTVDSVIDNSMALYALWAVDKIPHADDCDCDDCNPPCEDDCDCDDCNPPCENDCDCDDCNPPCEDDCDCADCNLPCEDDCDCDDCNPPCEDDCDCEDCIADGAAGDDGDDGDDAAAGDDGDDGDDAAAGDDGDDANNDNKKNSKNLRGKSPVGTTAPAANDPVGTTASVVRETAGPAADDPVGTTAPAIRGTNNDTRDESLVGAIVLGRPLSLDDKNSTSQETTITPTDVPLVGRPAILDQEHGITGIMPFVRYLLIGSATASIFFFILLAMRRKDDKENEEKRRRIRRLEAWLDEKQE